MKDKEVIEKEEVMKEVIVKEEEDEVMKKEEVIEKELELWCLVERTHVATAAEAKVECKGSDAEHERAAVNSTRET
ncbi:hypothetical protein Pcinc_017180 [Petrolisthes cinctipes]|uniref:Uncharacterized protein n=1 Tax=Petrolisthes cinctipes TaxID=88211 RepID=A0AAE1FQS9_PETCI|nr:hypothetical protein Pcinc_017180 [Petrolisthes cinctipes]